MAERRCPDCNTLVEVGIPVCTACGRAFPRDEKAGWTEGLNRVDLPQTPSSWLVVVAAFPLTLALFALLAWLDWFNLGDFSSSLLGLMLLFPLVAQLLPNLRRRGGGCCLGCLTWLSVAAAVMVASWTWSFEDPVRAREVKPVPRYRSGVPASVDGVFLGEGREELAKRLGKGRVTAYPWAPGLESFSLVYPGGSVVTLVKDQVVRVEGSRLEQEGQVLASSGDAFDRVGHLFETSAYSSLRRLYRDGNTLFGFAIDKGRIGRISTARRGVEVWTKPPSVTLDGVALGTPRAEVEPDREAVFDPLGRCTQIRGTELAFKGETVLKVGQRAALLRGKRVMTYYSKPRNFGGVLLEVKTERGTVTHITLRMPQVNKRSRK